MVDPQLYLFLAKNYIVSGSASLEKAFPEMTPLLCGAGHGCRNWTDYLGPYTGPNRIRGHPESCSHYDGHLSVPKKFLARLDGGQHLLVVADELHRLGSSVNRSALLKVIAGAALGLSATYRRQFDEAGTTALLDWFGGVLEPIIGIAEAIMLGMLTPYDYRLHTLELDEDELRD